MVPTASEVLALLTLIFQFLLELLKYMQTDDGKKFVNQALSDRQKWDTFWSSVSSGIQKLFNGSLFNSNQQPKL